MTAASWTKLEADPLAAMLIAGQAQTLAEAQEKYLNSHLADVVALVQSPLSEVEFRRHPLVALLLACGSRGWEDAVV